MRRTRADQRPASGACATHTGRQLLWTAAEIASSERALVDAVTAPICWGVAASRARRLAGRRLSYHFAGISGRTRRARFQSMTLQFLENNWYVVAIFVASGAMLAWSYFQG